MNIQELENILRLNKVPKELYSLKGGLPSEAFCIEKENDRWHVYYSERGGKTNIGYNFFLFHSILIKRLC